MWLLLLTMLICCAFTAALGLGAAVAARHRAESAADLAALAAAQGLLVDPGGVCGRAGTISAAHHAHLVGCTLGDDAVEVRVEVPVHGLTALVPPARGWARAGPLQAEGAPPDGIADATAPPPG